MLKTDMGIHYLIVYKDIDILRKFYSQYTKIQIEKNNEAVLLNPFYETVDSVRQFLYEDLDMNVSEHERKEDLLIIDALQTYFGQEPDREFKEKVALHSKEKGREGLSILNDTGAYPFKDMNKELVDYELSLPTVFDLPLRRFCLFHKADFERLTDEQKTKLIEHHGMALKIN
jgi:hypothetical protein